MTGSVNQELLLQNEFLAAENRILRTKLPTKLRLSNPERTTLAEIGKRKVLGEVACVAKPDTILAWYRKLVANKFHGSKHRQYPGRATVPPEVEALVVRMARENPAGVMIASSVRWPTSVITCRIRPLAVFHAVTGLPRLRSDAEPRPGRTLSARTRTFLLALTSLGRQSHRVSKSSDSLSRQIRTAVVIQSAAFHMAAGTDPWRG
jgi:hypothetical protein